MAADSSNFQIVHEYLHVNPKAEYIGARALPSENVVIAKNIK